MNKFSLENKIILVSGATSGIGLELCKQIVENGGDFINQNVYWELMACVCDGKVTLFRKYII